MTAPIPNPNPDPVPNCGRPLFRTARVTMTPHPIRTGLRFPGGWA